MSEGVIKTPDIQHIADEGARIYERIKERYEPHEKGKFLAIEVESGNAYLGTTSAEALVAAKQHDPGKMFYVVKIGFDVSETLAEYLLETRQA